MTVKSGFIPKGTVAGMHHRWEAFVDGAPVLVYQSYAYGRHHHAALRPRPQSLHRRDHGRRTDPFPLEPVNSDITGDIGYTGQVWTAMKRDQRIPQVVDAPPGIQTHLDLPLGTPRLVRPASG